MPSEAWRFPTLQRAGLAIVRVSIGIFFLGEAFNKRHWLGDPTILAKIFGRWLVEAGPVSHWYLEHIAVPGTRVFSVLVPVGELSVGLGLVAGAGLPWIALLAFFLTLNYNVASGALFRETILTNGNVIPMLGATLGLAVSAMRGRGGAGAAPSSAAVGGLVENRHAPGARAD